MAKSKKQEELESKARHPAGKGKGGGKSLTETQVEIMAKVMATPEDEILQVWVEHLTTAALLQNMEKLINEPKGWKKKQKEVMIKEFWKRFEILWGAFNHMNDIVTQLQRDVNPAHSGPPIVVLHENFVDDVVKWLIMYQQEIR